MVEVETLEQLLSQNTPLTAMLAPSFPIVFDFPDIVGQLRRLGFLHVVEVATGAKVTNETLIAAFKANATARFITSPCPSIVRTIREKYPSLLSCLALQIDSPMVATAKISSQLYPNSRTVFIGPCIAKKFESSEDHPDLNILVLTYKELQQLFSAQHISPQPEDKEADFDFRQPQTRLYPISGGLAQSSQIKDLLADDQIEVVSGWQNCIQALERFAASDQIKLLDILFCEGGCINGPGIESTLSLDDRRKKITTYWAQGIA